MALPTDAAERKDVPIASGVLDYFPDALAAVARLSQKGNEQHNPGQPLHWDRDKSTDEADALIRHFMERGTLDTDGIPHSAKVAWRALALLQKEEEDARGLPLPRGARSAQTAREAFVEAVYEEEEEEDGPSVPVFHPGERVRVVDIGGKFNYGPGFDNWWHPTMDASLGRTYIVYDQGESGVRFSTGRTMKAFEFPPLALERVNG